ncbi:MAG: PaaI family thioesterase [Syntrophomonadaceae bacterium]|jgi:uncharacterized protein (TIGR00369 family)|nr:PaaI family thioesterase [Syntrophomonadaceae bacterium]MDH7497491.1 PaaI family thioesterase [Syntrophomonadaceae bacterium]
MLNPAHVRAVIEMANRSPYFELLSMRIVTLEPGLCVVEIPLQQKHLNAFGGLHGGVYSSLIDTAAFWSAYCELDEGLGLTSLDVQVTNVAPATSGMLIGTGRRIKMGRTMCLTEGSVTSGEGKLLAHGTSKLLVTASLQTIDQAARAMGAGPLPPKFLDGAGVDLPAGKEG